MTPAAERVKVGISACFFHADPKRPIFTGKTLQYVEQSIAHWVMSTGAIAVMIPSPVGDTQKGDVAPRRLRELARRAGAARRLRRLARQLRRGAARGPMGRRPDPRRVRAGAAARVRRRGKPVLGVCRGLQLMNVAFGGTLLPGHRHPAPGRGPPSRRGHLRPQPARGRVRRRDAPGGGLLRHVVGAR